MTDPALQRLARGARVALIRLRSLGGCVLNTPALEILKRARPGSREAAQADQEDRPRVGRFSARHPAAKAIKHICETPTTRSLEALSE